MRVNSLSTNATIQANEIVAPSISVSTLSVDLIATSDPDAQFAFSEDVVFGGDVVIENKLFVKELLFCQSGQTVALPVFDFVAPPTSTSQGTKGRVVISEDYLYVCVDTNTWRRVALEAW